MLIPGGLDVSRPTMTRMGEWELGLTGFKADWDFPIYF